MTKARHSPTQPSRPSLKHRKIMAKVTQMVAEDAILTAFQLKSPRIIHMRLMVIRLLFMNRIITNILKQARTDFYSLLTGHMTERSAQIQAGLEVRTVSILCTFIQQASECWRTNTQISEWLMPELKQKMYFHRSELNNRKQRSAYCIALLFVLKHIKEVRHYG